MHMFRIVAAFAASLSLSLVAASAAVAQPGSAPGPHAQPGPYYPPPPPTYAAQDDGRRGLIFGVGLSAGSMATEDGSIECRGCEADTPAVAFGLHVGYMVTPRLAILVEASAGAKSLDETGDTTLMQWTGFAAAQYWLTRRLWIKGGLGASRLDIYFDDGISTSEEKVADGGALTGSLGYEVFSGRRFAVDLQLRFISAAYKGEQSDSIQTGSFGVGLNWY